MTDEQNGPTDFEGDAEKFPQQMLLVRDVFAFDFGEIAKVSDKFGSNSELFQNLKGVIRFLESAELESDEKEKLTRLIKEEIDVMSFSQTTRSSVVSL